MTVFPSIVDVKAHHVPADTVRILKTYSLPFAGLVFGGRSFDTAERP